MLCIRGLMIGFGVAWGIYMLVGGWCAAFGWGNAFVEVMSSIYIGYDASFLGGIIGGLWGFVDGAIFGLIFGVVYKAAANK